MRIAQGRLEIATSDQGFYELTDKVAAWLAQQGIAAGLLTLFLRHTSASLLIQENAAPAVQADLADFLHRLAPEDPARWRHDDEGPDDMPAHARAALLPTQLSIPVAGGQLMLGTWQGVYLVEHRRHPHSRVIVMHLIGE
ncbi:MAG: secondary thiamine-phosphate synthase enzyme YjbQ [Alphaproteobacteria bacterium]|nr:secondary thiamine-phosphate synthase enzyme YjbQ [Alphaproteobacteria bacterium]